VRRISISEAQAFDLFAQQKLGISSLLLMENAGRGAAEEAQRMLRGKKRVSVICGTGNNGGDGLVAARHLLNAGLKVKIFILGKASKIKADPKINLNILKNMGQKVIWAGGIDDLEGVKKSALIMDAIFGIGLTTAVKEPLASMISWLNQTKLPILSVDVPSGLHADTGKILGVGIKAKRTVTFVAPKKGFYRQAGPSHCGKIVVKDIGVVLNR